VWLFAYANRRGSTALMSGPEKRERTESDNRGKEEHLGWL
jgi:hypothetical protein